MSAKKYRIRLTTHQQHELKALVSRGRTAAYRQTHARILIDAGFPSVFVSAAPHH